MKKRKQFIQLLLIAGLLFASVIACDKTDDPGGDTPSAGTVKDADGNIYNTVKIGSQVWTVENLKTTKYNDGIEIINVTSKDQWNSIKLGAYCNYENLESNAEIYGRLYNWYAVNTGKLAPVGWHVSTGEDWTILQNYLISNGYNYDGTIDEDKIAKSLCAKSNWELSDLIGSPGNASENNNSSGFTALPGGYRETDYGHFDKMGKSGYWWISDEPSSKYDAKGLYLAYYNKYLGSFEIEKESGVSVRLVKD